MLLSNCIFSDFRDNLSRSTASQICINNLSLKIYRFLRESMFDLTISSFSSSWQLFTWFETNCYWSLYIFITFFGMHLFLSLHSHTLTSLIFKLVCFPSIIFRAAELLWILCMGWNDENFTISLLCPMTEDNTDISSTYSLFPFSCWSVIFHLLLSQ